MGMNSPRKSLFKWSARFAASGVLLGAVVLGQTYSSGNTPSSLTAIEQAFVQEQATLSQSAANLLATGASPQDMDNWQSQNAAALQSQQQLAQQIAAASELQPWPYITDVNIPDNASDQLSEFLTAQADLINSFVQIHNQQVQSLPSASGSQAVSTNAPITQMASVAQSETAIFQQQYATQIQAQQQRAQALASVAAKVPFPIPPPLVIPASASPDLQAYLTLHDQLVRENIQVLNANLGADPAVQTAAVNQWQQQNAANFAQLRQLAHNLAQSNTQ
ncbi:MAG: hypothetical protein WDO13_11475 [Verrucomicrobiota bacterium]